MQRDDASPAPEGGGVSSNENPFAAARDVAAAAAALLAPTQQPPLLRISKAPTRAVLSSVDGAASTTNISNLSQPSPLRKLYLAHPPRSTAEAEVGEDEARSDKKAAARDNDAETPDSTTGAKATTTVDHPSPAPTLPATRAHFVFCAVCDTPGEAGCKHCDAHLKVLSTVLHSVGV